MHARFGAADVAILVGYFVITLVVGFWRRRQSTEEYLIANRSLGLPVFVATLVATWYGGILGVGEFTYRWGLNNWTAQCFPYYLFAVVFALFLAPRVRVAGLYTIPDKLAREYDRPTALVGAIFAFLMITPAPYVLMVGQLVSILCGWPLPVSILVGTLFSIAYVYVGGFQSDVRINVFQFCLMFLGFAVALPCIVARSGGYGWLTAHLPAEHLRFDGGQSITFTLVWFLIALLTLVDPGFHQRCYAARTPAVARNGILVAVCCWAVFDFLTTSTGLYARAIMPALSDADARLAFPLLAERVLPPVVKGLFYVAMLATVMSTVVSYTFLGAMTVGRDFVWRLRGEESNESVPAYSRFGLLLTAAVAIGISLAIPSVVNQWWVIGTIFVPGMLFPIVSSYTRAAHVPARFALAGMVLGSGTSLYCLASVWLRHGLSADISDSQAFPFHVQPMYPGLAVGLTVYLLGLAARARHGQSPAPGRN